MGIDCYRMIHYNFTFMHFLASAGVLILLNILVLIYYRRKLSVSWQVVIGAFLFTSLGLFYREAGTSGTYNFTKYGFPKPIFEISRIMEGFDKNVDVRVFSAVRWKNLFQNWALFFLFLNLIKEIFRKR